VALAASVATTVVALGTDGKIASVGSLDEALKTDKTLQEEYDVQNKVLHWEAGFVPEEDEKPIDTSEEDSDAETGRLVKDEEKAEGSVSWASCKPIFLRESNSYTDFFSGKMLLTALGGRWPISFFLLAASGPTLRQISNAAQVWWLGVWAQQYLKMPAQEVNVA
jgi:hypothetical protein